MSFLKSIASGLWMSIVSNFSPATWSSRPTVGKIGFVFMWLCLLGLIYGAVTQLL
jgi:hypothetical protein